MTFTYSSTATTLTTLHKVRQELGDTDSSAPLFTDEELDYWIDARADNVLLAAADAADAAARKFARAYDFTADGQSFKRSQMAESYRKLAEGLRQRANGVATVEVTRVDGYSDDIGNQDVGETGTNPRRNFYGAEDRIP